MSAIDALKQLRYGGSVDCVTPDGKSFQIQSKYSYGISVVSCPTSAQRLFESLFKAE